MLNQSRVLNYIKSNLGFPFQPLELEDDYILDYITDYTLKTWSLYFPEKQKMKLQLNDDSLLANSRQNEFYLEESEGLEILNVVDLYFPASHFYALGHPYIGVYNFEGIKYFALAAIQAADAKMFSPYDYVFEFIHPNILQIMPVPDNLTYCIVEYERTQPSDLSGIPNDLQMIFNDLALADIKILIGNARKRFDGLRTPFGEIPVNQDLASEGKEERREIIDKLQTGSFPNIIMDIG